MKASPEGDHGLGCGGRWQEGEPGAGTQAALVHRPRADRPCKNHGWSVLRTRASELGPTAAQTASGAHGWAGLAGVRVQ